MNSSIENPSSDMLSYQPSEGFHDEAFALDGTMRPHWKYLLDSLQSLGPQALTERQNKAARILRDDGATYNFIDQPMASQVWGLDPVPLVLDSGEWGVIESGLIERTELFNLILKDIYGSRDLIRSGILPPEAIYSHRGFLRQCDGIQLPGEHQMIVHAADMVRSADGSMVILGDRTQIPSGAGYALENRTVMSRVFPSLFRDSHVHRLALFFQSLRTKLNELVPADKLEEGETATIVILTPGAYSETYFEHAYLANYLGFPLVQGGDLTVRGGKVWMKTVSGLIRVDVILRRVDDNFCDPVELKADSHLGIPGLVEAVRTRQVVVANPLGSGVIESPAILRYLPEISRFFLGRELQLKSVETHWCGDPNDLEYVVANLSSLMIKPTIRRHVSSSILGHELDETQKQELIAKIRAKPNEFAAQAYIVPSTSPSWHKGALAAHPSILRSFAVASDNSYSIMPGGLTRVAEPSKNRVGNRWGAISKDTWVLASEPEKQISLLARNNSGGHLVEQASVATLPSRVVENLFWMGRYAERASALTRLMRTVLIQLNSSNQLDDESRGLLISSLYRLTTNNELSIANTNPELISNPDEELLSLILDGQREGSVRANLNSMLHCAEQVKEMLSADATQIVNSVRDEIEVMETTLRLGLTSAPEEALDPLVAVLLAMVGQAHESMFRGIGWRFLQMGRNIEKTYQTAMLLRAMMVPKLSENSQDTALESLLLSSEALISFRRKYRNQGGAFNGLDLMFRDTSNPRSLLYQLERLREHADCLPSAQTNSSGLSAIQRVVLELTSAIQLCHLTELEEFDPVTGRREHLNQFLGHIQGLLLNTAVTISDRYFDHTGGPQQLVKTGWDGDI